MNIRRRILTTLIVIAAGMCVADSTFANGTLIRWHKMGEEEGGTNNTAVGTTLDSPVPIIDGIADIQPLDLTAANAPTYRTIVGRPDGGGGIGIEFNAASSQNLSGSSLNWPQQSALNATEGGIYDLTGIADRGFQFWVRPTSTADQAIVMDTLQHGVRIKSGKFAMVYDNNAEYLSNITVAANTWYHVEVVRPAGAGSGSRMYVNGIAAAAGGTSSDYAGDQVTPLTVGSSPDNTQYFSGIVDDLRMFVLGTTNNGLNYGAFNFATDNAFAASPISGIKGVAGDVTNNGILDAADKTAFIAGWMDKRLVNGVQIADMQSRSQGDLNLDGITNIQDLLLLQNALIGAGIGTITAADLGGVPEPTTLVLLLTAMAAMPRRFRRSARS